MSSIPLTPEHEEIGALWDQRTGLRAIVAVHSTVLGPSLGGTRMHAYDSYEEAMADVLRLSKAMSYKASLAGLELGGGKAVVIGDPATGKSEALLERYARFVGTFEGRYLTAEDVGMSQDDMDFMGRFTPFVTGRSVELGGSGDPSPVTAYGVVRAMEAAAEAVWDSASLEGRHVAVSGVGKVGGELARLCAERGGRVTVADVDPGRAAAVASETGSEVAEPSGIHRIRCDVFAPCALGGVLNRETAPELGCRVVCGAANNQLAEPSVEEVLDRRGITYVPDYLVNAGGIINIAYERGGYDATAAREHVGRIFDTTRTLFAEAERTGKTLSRLADERAQARIAGAVAARPGAVAVEAAAGG